MLAQPSKNCTRGNSTVPPDATCAVSNPRAQLAMQGRSRPANFNGPRLGTNFSLQNPSRFRERKERAPNLDDQSVSPAAVYHAVGHAGQSASDPFLGDWQGEGLVAQVIPRGGGNYQINFLPEFDVKCKPLAAITGQTVDGVLRFEQDGWSGQAAGERMTGTRPGNGQGAAFELKQVVRLSPTVGAKPPRTRSSYSTAPDSSSGKSNPRRTPARRSRGNCARISCGLRPFDKEKGAATRSSRSRPSAIFGCTSSSAWR